MSGHRAGAGWSTTRRVLFVAVLSLLVIPSGAIAGTLTRDASNNLVYTASPGETNSVDVMEYSPSSGYYLSDYSATVVDSGAGCSPFTDVAGHTYWYCSGVSGYRISLGDGNDVLYADAYEAYNSCGCTTPATLPMIVDGGSGNDSITGGSGDDVLDGGSGSDYIDGSAGTNTATYAGRGEGVNVYLDNNANDGGASDSHADNVINVRDVIGGGADDTLSAAGSSIPVTLEGRGGADNLTAGNGAAHLIGGDGNDQLFGGSANDTLDGGPGADTLVPLAGSDTVLAGTGVDSVNTQDGAIDSVDCGGNKDNVTADANDTITNCTDPAPPPTTNTTTTGSSDSAPQSSPAPSTPAPLPAPTLVKLAPKVGLTATAGPSSTKISRLTISKIASGATLTAKCRTKTHKKCAGTKDYKRAKAPSTLRLKGFEKKLPVGAKITITETKAGAASAVDTLTIRKSKKPLLIAR